MCWTLKDLAMSGKDRGVWSWCQGNNTSWGEIGKDLEEGMERALEGRWRYWMLAISQPKIFKNCPGSQGKPSWTWRENPALEAVLREQSGHTVWVCWRLEILNKERTFGAFIDERLHKAGSILIVAFHCPFQTFQGPASPGMVFPIPAYDRKWLLLVPKKSLKTRTNPPGTCASHL